MKRSYCFALIVDVIYIGNRLKEMYNMKLNGVLKNLSWGILHKGAPARLRLATVQTHPFKNKRSLY